MVPETADVFALLKDGDVGVAESGKESGTTDAGRTASDHGDRTAVRLGQIGDRYTTIAHLWNA